MATQEQQQNLPSTSNYQDYMSKFKKEEEYFKAPRTSNGKQWPRIKPVEQRVYENWIAQVVDPVTGEYHKDQNGNSARYVVNKIVRIRLLDGTEKLYSYGQLIGYNSFKDKKTYACDQPEVHQKTNFGYKTTLDQKNNQIKRVTTGPESVEDVYDMPFTKENADKLWSLRKDRSIKLTVKDQLSNEPRAVHIKGDRQVESNLNDTFEMFKNSQFDYLYNWEYLKESTTTKRLSDKELSDMMESDAQAMEEMEKQRKELEKAQPDTKSKTRFEPEKIK